LDAARFEDKNLPLQDMQVWFHLLFTIMRRVYIVNRLKNHIPTETINHWLTILSSRLKRGRLLRIGGAGMHMPSGDELVKYFGLAAIVVGVGSYVLHSLWEGGVLRDKTDLPPSDLTKIMVQAMQCPPSRTSPKANTKYNEPRIEG